MKIYVYASERRKFWHFYILKVLFLSIFCRYKWHACRLTCTDKFRNVPIKLRRSIIGGGGGGNCPPPNNASIMLLNAPPPPPSGYASVLFNQGRRKKKNPTPQKCLFFEMKSAFFKVKHAFFCCWGKGHFPRGGGGGGTRLSCGPGGATGGRKPDPVAMRSVHKIYTLSQYTLLKKKIIYMPCRNIAPSLVPRSRPVITILGWEALKSDPVINGVAR